MADYIINCVFFQGINSEARKPYKMQASSLTLFLHYSIMKKMRTTTALQINRYYDLYQNLNLTFTNEVSTTLGVKKDQVAIRCGGKDWPCIINSASMKEAKLISAVSQELLVAIKENHQNVSIRFAFDDFDSKDPLTFYVTSKIKNLSTFESKRNSLILITLAYIQKAPDDLIEKLGFVIEANINSTRRSSERLSLNDESIHKIDLLSRDAFVFVQGIPRRCVLIDISFSGAKLVLMGIANFLLGQEATVKFDFDKPQTTIGVKGKIIRAEHVEGRKDLIAIAVTFYEAEIPLIFKVHLNKFFSQHRISREIDMAKAEKESYEISQAELQKENDKKMDKLLEDSKADKN